MGERQDGYWDWPTRLTKWWWMEYQRNQRCKKVVILVSLFTHEGVEYVQPHQDNNCYPKSFAKDWNARFKPCESSPVFD